MGWLDLLLSGLEASAETRTRVSHSKFSRLSLAHIVRVADANQEVYAQIGLIALSVLTLEEDRQGNGRHLWDITGYQFVAYAKVNLLICTLL